MKKIKQLSFIIIAALLTLSSCTMQKRIYNRGFHIEWLEGHGSEKVATTQAKKAEKKKGVKTEQNEETIASNENLSDPAQSDPLILTITENKSVLNVVNEKEAMNLVASKVYFKSHKASNLDADKKAHSLSKPVLKAAVKHYTKPNNMNDVPLVLIYILCFFIPPIAVGLITDWDATPVISNILWTLLCGIPGIIHALIVVGRES